MTRLAESDVLAITGACQRARRGGLDASQPHRAPAAAVMPKINADPRCERPNDCRAKGKGICRVCTLRRLHADPEFAARNSERMKRLNADPEFRAKRGFLTAQQIRQIGEQIASTKTPYVEIALDWLISPHNVCLIAKRFGVQRRPRKARP